jgi:hypothetical protein
MPWQRTLSLVLAAGIIGSCQSSGSTNATPPCGGFHLRVINQSSGLINVDVNDTPAVLLAAGDEKILGQYLPPQLPAMPWTVVVRRSTDGSEIGDAHFLSGPDRDLFVSNNGLDEESFAPPTPSC